MEFIIEQMRRARRDEGFTLIELLIVILILGILAGIAVFASGPFRDKATAACQDANTEIGIVANAATDAGVSGDLYAQGPGDCAGTGGTGGATAAPTGGSVTIAGNVGGSQPGTITASIGTAWSGNPNTFQYTYQLQRQSYFFGCYGDFSNQGAPVGPTSATSGVDVGENPNNTTGCYRVRVTVSNGVSPDGTAYSNVLTDSNAS